MPGGQDLVDTTIDSISENCLEQIHCCAPCAAIVVTSHENGVGVVPLIIYPINPVVPKSAGATVQWTMCVHKEHSRPSRDVLQANPVHPSLPPLVLCDPFRSRFSNPREDCGVPRQGARVGIRALEGVVTCHARVLQDGCHVIALLEANQVEWALVPDSAVESIPPVVLLDIPPVQVVACNDDAGLASGPRALLVEAQRHAPHRRPRPLDHRHAAAAARAAARGALAAPLRRASRCGEVEVEGEGRAEEQQRQPRSRGAPLGHCHAEHVAPGARGWNGAGEQTIEEVEFG
eukprot:CAMPEP_0115477858 /NCGR_PEP_ID=MMETSP0271-20121206/55895_1 /TAXON_ID=71861 /ORGANISM="Scrippsiella trochoidea, Strain CCMP3099" /LENGTH=289 /DNA_ID=CAMNT_0002905367 /DNA_START=252 /DNA_END=1117 /DNA_ORIENTATION=-